MRIRKLSLIIVTVLVLVVGGALLLPKLIPLGTIANQIKAQVKEATGRELNFASIESKTFPKFTVKLSGVTLSNPEWAEESNMLAIESMDISLALKPLLTKKIKIENVVVNNPVLDLEVDAKGQKNWDMGEAQLVDSAAAPVENVAVSDKTKLGGFAVILSNLKVNNATVKISDATKSLYEKVESMNLSASMPDVKSSMSILSDFVFKGEGVKASLTLMKPLDFASGAVSPGDFSIESKNVALKGAGVLATKGEFLSANVEAKTEDAQALRTWLGMSSENAANFNNFYFSGEVRTNGKNLVLSKSNIEAGELKANGDLSVDFTDKPDVFARLDVSHVNVDKFISSGAAEASDKAEGKKVEDNKAIDFSAVKGFNADVVLKSQGFILGGVDVGASDITLKLKEGNLSFQSTKAKIFEGDVVFGGTLNAYSAKPTMALELEASDVKAKQFLSQFMNFNKIGGLSDVKVSISSSGTSKKDIVANLKGNGSIAFKKGTFEGIDLAGIANLLQKRSQDISVGEGKTEFVEMKGNFSVDDGIVTSNDMTMTGPLVNATGSGSVYLTKKYVDFKVTPELVLLKKEDVKDLELLNVPVKIKGQFDHIKVKPEYKYIAKTLLKDPKAASKALNAVKEEVKDIKREFKTEIKANIDGMKDVRTSETPEVQVQPNAADAKTGGDVEDSVKAIQNFIGNSWSNLVGAVGDAGKNADVKKPKTND